MTLRRLLCDSSGASAAEFALVTPLFLLFLLGIIDSGFYAWRFNQTEKAAQMGVRLAVVTDLVSNGLKTETYAGKTCAGKVLTPGDPICAALLGRLTCGSSGDCTCSATPCPTTLTRDSAAFDKVAARIKGIAPWVKDDNIQVEYTGSGIGYADDKSGASMQPIVGVKLINVKTQPLTGMLFRAQLDLPNIIRSLPMEDGSGTQSN